MSYDCPNSGTYKGHLYIAWLIGQDDYPAPKLACAFCGKPLEEELEENV